MAQSEVRGLETTIQKTNEWIEDIREEIGCMDKEEAYLALSSTLHALRDRLMPEEAIDLGAQLPVLIRGIYYDGYTMSGKPLKIRSKDDFVALVGRELRRNPELDPEGAAEGVFAVLDKKISKGEIKDIKSQLPKDIKELWH
jgi:uncharacterized protein (DUF2267 family)